MSGTTDLLALGAYARIRTIDRRLEGFTPICFLQPNIHTGTVILMARDWSDGLTLAPRRDAATLIDLRSDANVKVLGYYPQLHYRMLFVKVLEGPYTNRRGWMDIADVAPPPKLDATNLCGDLDSS